MNEREPRKTYERVLTEQENAVVQAVVERLLGADVEEGLAQNAVRIAVSKRLEQVNLDKEGFNVEAFVNDCVKQLKPRLT